tara:strand:- start:5343 stop:7022 length:1680 start_codon:yes stop_codon:yes gene_type:complete
MIEIFLILILLIFAVFFSGYIFVTIFLKLKLEYLEIYEVGFFGIIFLVFLSFILHLFVPLNEITNSLIFFLILLIFIFKIKKKNQLNFINDYKYIFISLILVFIMTLKYNPNEDYGYYHLPYIINLVSEKVIFGLSNLQPQFGWNSTWLNFSSMFYLPYFEIRGTQLSNSILYFFIIYMFLKEIYTVKNKSSYSFLYILLLTSYTIIKFSRISEHGFDFPANFFLLLAIYYFLKISEEQDLKNINKYFIIICCFSLFSFTIKVSTFIAPLLVIFSLILILKKKIKLDIVKDPFIFCTIFFAFWITQQFIYTGCMLPYFKITCMQGLDWHTKDISNMISGLTGSVNKSYNLYTGDLSPSDYSKNFNWVSTWFQRNKIEILEHILAIILPIIILLILNLKFLLRDKANILILNNHKKFILLSLSVLTIFGLIIWFIKSPVIRFGIPYIFLLFFLMLIIIIDIIKIKFTNSVNLLIILCLFFNLSKNFNRIIDNKSETYWPKILSVKFLTKEMDGFQINFPDQNTDNPKRKLCWSIPHICSVSQGNNLKFYKKNTYTFVKSE